MIEITITGNQQRIASIEQLDSVLVRSEQYPQFELWVLVANSPRMAMLRSGVNAWLMYLRFNGNAGFIPQGDPTRTA